MPKPPRTTKKPRSRPTAPAESSESRASEAATIAWTSSVTGVFIADFIVIAAHLYARLNPDATAAKVLEAIMLLSAATMGAISLALMIVVWRTRVAKPPVGFTVFAVLCALGPIVALVGAISNFVRIRRGRVAGPCHVNVKTPRSPACAGRGSRRECWPCRSRIAPSAPGPGRSRNGAPCRSGAGRGTTSSRPC